MRTLAYDLVLLIVFLVLITAPVFAGEQKPPVTTFSARSELVLVPVIVTDKSGVHIGGLKKDDFSLFQDSAEQKIAVFEEVNTSKMALRKAKVDPREFTNMVDGPQRPTRITIIALDGINTAVFDQLYARQAVLKYLDNVAEADETIAVMVLTRGGIKVIHSFTTDPKVLKLALQKVKGANAPVVDTELDGDTQQALAEEQADLKGFATMSDSMRQSTDFLRQSANFQSKLAIIATMEALQQVADAFAGVPGRKSLIWASAGFPFSIDPSYTLEGRGFPRDSVADVLPMYERTWEILNSANIAMYPVDVRGLINPGMTAASAGGYVNLQNPAAGLFRQSMRYQDSLDTLKSFAEMTGGKAYYNTNDLVTAFQHAAEDSSAYYMLGFYLDPKTTKPGYRKLHVKVGHAGAHVRARQGFFVTAATQDAARGKRVDMSMALTSPLEFTALPLTGRWTDIAASPTAGKKMVNFQLRLPAGLNLADTSDNNHLVLDIVARAITEDGSTADEFGQTVEGHLKPAILQKVNQEGLTYMGALDLAPGDYSVRFVVRDDLKGRMGTVTASLKVAQ